ncbi:MULTISPECIES: response regulator transcription factor [Sphingobium]|uniref:response regulator transcription factor n=1 Tax=Sphingobium TaxID=165695 RepID=UPI002101D2FD|nr:response regulator [Sphingobium sp. 15-1]
MRTKSPIYVVIGDALLRRHLVAFLRAHHYAPTPFSNGSDFLDAAHFLGSGIAVLDTHLPDMPGMLVLQDLLMERQDIPVIMTSQGADIRAAVQMIKRGADDFLEQPFDERMLLETIESTASLLEERVERQQNKTYSKLCMMKLSKRELDVLRELEKFDDNHIVAQRLKLTVRSVETYRSRIMRKCGTSRFSDAVAMCREAMS